MSNEFEHAVIALDDELPFLSSIDGAFLLLRIARKTPATAARSSMFRPTTKNRPCVSTSRKTSSRDG
jgi:hypothetical protein